MTRKPFAPTTNLVDLAAKARALFDFDKHHFCLVGLIAQPGIKYYGTLLEWEYFPPKTELNKLFEVKMVKVAKKPHVVVRLPLHYLITAHLCAFQCGYIELMAIDEYEYLLTDTRSVEEYSSAKSRWTMHQQEIEAIEKLLSSKKEK